MPSLNPDRGEVLKFQAPAWAAGSRCVCPDGETLAEWDEAAQCSLPRYCGLLDVPGYSLVGEQPTSAAPPEKEDVPACAVCGRDDFKSLAGVRSHERTCKAMAEVQAEQDPDKAAEAAAAEALAGAGG